MPFSLESQHPETAGSNLGASIEIFADLLHSTIIPPFVHTIDIPCMRQLLFFPLYLFRYLPAAWFMGIRPVEITDTACRVRLPYSWRSQNPFRSIYFAAQCAAGEMASGLPALEALRSRPPCSMLVLRAEAEFLKKADRTLVFTCADVAGIREAIARAFDTGTPQTVRALAVGALPDGTEATRVWITWTFRVKTGASGR